MTVQVEGPSSRPIVPQTPMSGNISMKAGNNQTKATKMAFTRFVN